MHVLRRKGGGVNTIVAVATPKAFIARSQNEDLKCIDLDSSNWEKSLLRCMSLQKENTPALSQKFQNWQKRKQS